MLGGWAGLFFDNDNGYMSNKLFSVLTTTEGGGFNTTYPIEYMSEYVDPAEYGLKRYTDIKLVSAQKLVFTTIVTATTLCATYW